MSQIAIKLINNFNNVLAGEGKKVEGFKKEQEGVGWAKARK